jgi:type IV secretion system protein VirD4
MLDEFRQLQRMDAIVEKIPISAGYGFRMAIIIQNMSQLDEIYGKASREGIVANCALKLFVSVDDLATANYVSDQLGQKTVETSTVNLRRGGSMFGERSVTKGLTGVPLMRPDEVIRLPKDRSILMIANERPILTTKIRYDKDRMFRKLGAAGRSAFRNVPDVPDLAEEPLAILSKAYGKEQPAEAPKPMAKPAVIEEKTADIPEMSKVQASSEGTTVEGILPETQPFPPLAPMLAQSVEQEKPKSGNAPTVKRGPKTPSSRKRPADPIMALAPVTTKVAPIDDFRRVRSAAIGLETIADMIKGKGRSAGETDDDGVAALMADLRHAARASQLDDHGDLIEGV